MKKNIEMGTLVKVTGGNQRTGEFGYIRKINGDWMMDDREFILEMFDGIECKFDEKYLSEDVNGVIIITESALEYILSLSDNFFESSMVSSLTGLPLTEEQISEITKIAIQESNKPENHEITGGEQPDKNINLDKYAINPHAIIEARRRWPHLKKKNDVDVERTVRKFAKRYIKASVIMLHQKHPEGPVRMYVSFDGNVVISIDNASVITIYSAEYFGKKGAAYIPRIVEVIRKCMEENKKKTVQ